MDLLLKINVILPCAMNS